MTPLPPGLARGSGATPNDAASVRPVEHAPTTADSSSVFRALASNSPDAPAPHDVTDLGPSRPFAEVLAGRSSDRGFARPDAADVGTVLARAALVRRRWSGTDGYARTSRPAPSAGARHPHVLVLLVHDVAGLASGAWVLDPDRAVLRPAIHDPTRVSRALAAIGDALRSATPPPAAVLTVAAPAATLARYPSGMSLVWRDAGALLATIHLSATDIGLASCLVGTAGTLHDPDDDPDGLLDTGAVALGARP